jgi:hypothetical protein
MDIKTRKDLFVEASAGLRIDTALCGIVQNVETDDDMSYGAGSQAMRLESQFRPNLEWQLPTNEELIDGPCAMMSQSMDVKTGKDLFVEASAGLRIDTAMCGIVQNVKTDDDMSHGAGSQAMRLDCQEWQLPTNQESQITTTEDLIAVDFNLL